MRKILLLSTCLLAVNASFGQSDKNFTHYMADQISFNPGATGFRGICGTLIYRNQWFGFEGAPNSYLFNAQANLQEQGMGIGISYLHDNVGFFSENDFKINIAKHFEIVGAGYLSLGLGFGLVNGSFDPTWIPPDPTTPDPNLPIADGASALDLNFGAFWRDADERYYVGLSSTHLTAPNLNTINFDKARHYYATGGMNIRYDMLPIVDGLTLKPSFLVISDFVSTTMDVTLIANYDLTNYQAIYGGLTYRRKDALAVLIGYSTNTFDPGTLDGDPDVLNIGLSYDITTSDINTPSNGSLEVWANYCMFAPDPARARHGNVFILD
ncbi:MAG: PorP/SprF family type IX secretion system membrane protein [Crocinitomicaceae bacterium]